MSKILVVLLVLAAIVGCAGGGIDGSYVAEIRLTGNVTKEKSEQLKSEPKQMLNLESGGTFTTTRGSQTVWKGRWRVESDKLSLRAEEVNGIPVGTNLQADAVFTIQKDGSIVDGRTSGDGYERVYHRR